MPKRKFTKDKFTIETSLPTEQARLRAEGFQEVKDEKPKTPANTNTSK